MLTQQRYGVMALDTTCSTGHSKYLGDDVIIAPGLGSSCPLTTVDVRHYPERKTGPGMSEKSVSCYRSLVPSAGRLFERR
jgi:hypothetical protein